MLWFIPRWPFRKRGALVRMVPKCPHLMLPFRVTLTRCITRNTIPVDSNRSGDAEIRVRSLGHFGSTDDTVRAKEPMAVAGMQSPRIGTGNVSFPECVFCNAHGICFGFGMIADCCPPFPMGRISGIKAVERTGPPPRHRRGKHPATPGVAAGGG